MLSQLDLSDIYCYLFTPLSYKLLMKFISMSLTPTVVKEKAGQTIKQHYPNYKIIVLNDDHNTFPYVIECLLKYIPGMNGDRARELTDQIHFEGQAMVWAGPQEQAELYHQQLSRAGLTMAPLEKA
jgi:ATP-dependent Clp protease adaptor protein ClpS